jgi:polysaccharide export outer membrane protein
VQKGGFAMRKFVFIIVFLMIVIGAHTDLSSGAEKTTRISRESTFYLGPQDVLEISVWKDEALTKKVVVRPDGMISFPLIGQIPAAGRTVEQLQTDIQRRISAYVPDAPVTVLVEEIGSPKVYVVGKVSKPGVYIMGHYLRVMQALAMAGGTTTFADRDDIMIIREEDGRQIIMKFNYDRVASGMDLHKNIMLKPGDTVVVP